MSWQSSGPLYGRLTICWQEHSVYSRRTGTFIPLSQLSIWKVTGDKFPQRIPLLMTDKPWWIQTSDAWTNPEVLPHPYRENNTWQMKWQGKGELCQGHNYLQEITQKGTKSSLCIDDSPYIFNDTVHFYFFTVKPIQVPIYVSDRHTRTYQSQQIDHVVNETNTFYVIIVSGNKHQTHTKMTTHTLEESPLRI